MKFDKPAYNFPSESDRTGKGSRDRPHWRNSGRVICDLVPLGSLAMKLALSFLDEITSGLDSGNANIVIELLKDMYISPNVAVAVVIHQPSSEIFDCFQRLVICRLVAASFQTSAPTSRGSAMMSRGLPYRNTIACLPIS
jgi:hypothetical protein